MPELVSKGPDIPTELLNEHGNGNVVFFCGAGISVDSGLPNFSKLVDHVYRVNKLEPDRVERQALDLDQLDEKLRKPKLDKVLGLLERPERLGSQMRRTIVKRLSGKPKGPLLVHRALLGLSNTGRGTRIITTNFDNRFVEAGFPKSHVIDASPKLSVPKLTTWNTLVHLHGRIARNGDGSDLVLTSADFGRAYLTERWASRFVTELFRNYTVVFIGYSLDDPVMAYMVDALAAEHSIDSRYGRAYAFAAHSEDDGDRDRTVEAWEAKSVTPIPYSDVDRHRLLSETIIAWDNISRDPFAARIRIAKDSIQKMPSGPLDPDVTRACWAVEEPSAAEALANLPPLADESDYPKIEAWLPLFDGAGLLSRSIPPENDRIKDARLKKLAPRYETALVDSGRLSSAPLLLDPTTRHLAFWIARHIHVPQVLAWVLGKGGRFHPHLKDFVRQQLAAENREPPIPDRMRVIWTVLAEDVSIFRSDLLWFKKHHEIASSTLERDLVASALVESLMPALVVSPGPSFRTRMRRVYGKGSDTQQPYEELAHLKVVVGSENHEHLLGSLLSSSEFLGENATTFTNYLVRALALLKSDAEYIPYSVSYRPSIAPHNQNRNREKWAALIDWVRDGYMALAEGSPQKAQALLGLWLSIDEPLFKRLALHALTEDKSSDIRKSEGLLLRGRKPGLWDIELRREVLRFLRLAGSRLPRDLLAKYVNAILAGPRRGKRYDERYRENDIKHRLFKLTQAGRTLSKRARGILGDFAIPQGELDDDRDEFSIWIGEARWIPDEERHGIEYAEKTALEISEAVEASSISVEAFEGEALRDPQKALSVLLHVGRKELWPDGYWQRYLWALAGLRRQKKLSSVVLLKTFRALLEVPDQLFSKIGSTAGDFVEHLSETTTVSREQCFSRLWVKVWRGGDHQYELGTSDVLTQALNHSTGKLAQAALNRLWKYKPTNRSGIPKVILPYFDAVAGTPSGHLGRVMFVSQLNNLFLIDPDWTRVNLITRLSPAASPEAKDLWMGYAWSPRLGPNLLTAFKAPFLEILKMFGDRGHREENLLTLFISICMNAPAAFTASEIRDILNALPESGHVVILRRLADWFEGEPKQRSETWKKKIKPWLTKHWPAQLDRHTSATSEALVHVLLGTGTAFPDAVQWASRYLRPVQQRGLFELKESSIPRTYPAETLQLLTCIVEDGVLPVWERSFLREILEAVREVRAGMAANGEWIALYHLATR